MFWQPLTQIAGSEADAKTNKPHYHKDYRETEDRFLSRLEP